MIRRPARTTHLDLAVLQREVNLLLERLADFDRSSSGDGEWIPGVDVYECAPITASLEDIFLEAVKA